MIPGSIPHPHSIHGTQIPYRNPFWNSRLLQALWDEDGKRWKREEEKSGMAEGGKENLGNEGWEKKERPRAVPGDISVGFREYFSMERGS